MLRDSPVRRAISRTDIPSRKCQRRITLINATSITPQYPCIAICRVGLYVGQNSMQIPGVNGSILDAIQHSQFRGFVLPPLQYDLTRARLNQTGMQNRWYAEGGQIAGMALAGAFGGFRVICGNDLKAFQTYRSLLSNLIQNPARLHKLKANASRSLYAGIAGTHITVLTAAGSTRLPIRLLNHSAERNVISLGGIGMILLDHKNEPIKISDRTQRNYRVYLKICLPHN